MDYYKEKDCWKFLVHGVIIRTCLEKHFFQDVNFSFIQFWKVFLPFRCLMWFSFDFFIKLDNIYASSHREVELSFAFRYNGVKATKFPRINERPDYRFCWNLTSRWEDEKYIITEFWQRIKCTIFNDVPTNAFTTYIDTWTLKWSKIGVWKLSFVCS